MNALSSFLEMYEATPMYAIYWAIAAVASTVFVFQAISLFAGFDTDSDFSGGDASFDADGLNLVSVKTVACLLLGFGWTGVLFYGIIENPLLLAGLALLVGLGFMVIIAFLLRQVLRLSQDNTFRVEKAVGKVGEVYLRIPADGQKDGKISVSVEGSVHELQAKNLGCEDIPTGAKVRILQALDSNTVVVEAII